MPFSASRLLLFHRGRAAGSRAGSRIHARSLAAHGQALPAAFPGMHWDGGQSSSPVVLPSFLASSITLASRLEGKVS